MFPGLPIHITLMLILASYLVLTSLVMLWAGLGKTHWFWRAMGAVGWMGLFVVARAADVVVLTAVLGITIVGPCWLARCVAAWRTGNFRFRLSEILLAVIPVAMLAAFITRFDTTLPASYLASLGLVFGIYFLGLAWLALGQRWWGARLLLAVMMACGVFAALWKVDYFVAPLIDTSTMLDGLKYDMLGNFHPLLLVAVLITTSLLFFLTPLVLTRSAQGVTATRTRRVLKAITLLSVAPLLFVFSWVYWRVVEPVPPIVADAPVPNSYEELLRLSENLKFSEIPHRNNIVPTAVKQVVSEHQGELATIRGALDRPGRVVLPDGEGAAGKSFGTHSLLIQLYTVLGLLEEVESRGLDRARVGVDLLQLAKLTSVGGDVSHVLASRSGYIDGAETLSLCIADLNQAECQTLIAKLIEIEQGLEPAAVVHERDRNWGLRNLDWSVRMAQAAKAMAGVQRRGDKEDIENLGVVMSQHVALLRLLQTELALRCYFLEHQRYPEYLDELTPSFLSNVPSDPFSVGPLKYRRTEDGFLLYSLGGNSQDDGGQSANYFFSDYVDLSLDMFRQERAERESEKQDQASPVE